MLRLFVIVEGETEEAFVNEVLAPHLYGCGFHSVAAKLMGNARMRDRRGGIRGWPSVRSDIVRHLSHDPQMYVTTMVDFYGLPQGTSQKAWPGRAEAASLPFNSKALKIEFAIQAEIKNEMGESWNSARFVPFVILHEFEGLLFSDCGKLASGINRTELAAQFQAIRDLFESPEHINDSKLTHPSQRILELVPEYEKPLHGNLAALEIGFHPIRNECPHFRDWLSRLEKLADPSPQP